MSKAIDFLSCAALATGSGLLTVAAWGASEAFMEVPAPITPLMWLCAAFFGFCTVAYTGAALAAPFRKA